MAPDYFAVPILHRIKTALNDFLPDYFGHTCEGMCNPPEISDDVKKESSRTMYHWDGKGRDPNRDPWLCRLCAEWHHEHWDSAWADYQGRY